MPMRSAAGSFTRKQTTMQQNLSKSTVIKKVKNYVAAGTTDTQSTALVDAAGFDTVTFVASIGTVAATATLNAQAQTGNASNGSDLATIAGQAGAQVITGDGNSLVVLEVHRPAGRYVQLNLIRGVANITIESVVAILSNAKGPLPEAPDATVITACSGLLYGGAVY